MTEKQIFDYLVKSGLSEAGAAGLTGNLIAESGLRSNNLQNSFEKILGMDDDTYTAAVDSGIYQNFVNDSAGYGLAQWTFWSRKQNLLDFAKSLGKSIGDCQMQLDFLMKEIRGYGTVWGIITRTNSVQEASDAVLLQYERPADQSISVRSKRAMMGQEVYSRCKGAVPTSQPVTMESIQQEVLTVSKLAIDHVEFGTVNSNTRKNKVSKITIHHMAGIMTGVRCAQMHLTNAQQASANYYIGNDGDICSGVREDRRAWTSSTGNEEGTNDHRAITIEVSNSAIGDASGWPISDKAYKSLITLCADICKRYNIDPYFDGTPNATLTAHYMFAATACPGPYIKKLLQSGKIAADIKAAMGNTQPGFNAVPVTPQTGNQTLYRVQIGAFQKKENADALAAELKAKGETCLVMQAQGLFKVQVGSFANLTNAKKKSEELMRAGYKTYISEVNK